MGVVAPIALQVLDLDEDLPAQELLRQRSLRASHEGKVVVVEVVQSGVRVFVRVIRIVLILVVGAVFVAAVCCQDAAAALLRRRARLLPSYTTAARPKWV